MDSRRLTPITRQNKFFSEKEFDLEIQFAREFVEDQGNYTVILYRVDRELSEFDKLYGEASSEGIRFKPPVELRVFPSIEDPENKAYNKNAGTLRYTQSGKLVFDIFKQQLSELGVEISYGDYIGYPVSESKLVYFTVTNDGVIDYNNTNTILGYKGAYRTITCAPVDNNEFTAI